MIEPKVRMGTVEDQDRYRREDLLAMTPDERVMTLIGLRDRQFGAVAKRIRDSGVFRCRRHPPHSQGRESDA